MFDGASGNNDGTGKFVRVVVSIRTTGSSLAEPIISVQCIEIVISTAAVCCCTLTGGFIVEETVTFKQYAQGFCTRCAGLGYSTRVLKLDAAIWAEWPRARLR